MSRFCAICTAPETEDNPLELSEVTEEGRFLECLRCREEHPRLGGYAFDASEAAAGCLKPSAPRSRSAYRARSQEVR